MTRAFTCISHGLLLTCMDLDEYRIPSMVVSDFTQTSHGNQVLKTGHKMTNFRHTQNSDAETICYL